MTAVGQAQVQKIGATTGRRRHDALARPRRAVARGALYALICFGAFIELLPLLWMLSSALKPTEELFRIPPTWIPSRLVWSNFRDGLTYMPFDRFFVNTSLIAGITAVGAVLSASLVAFSFARLRWPGRDAFFTLFLTAMMIPDAVRIVPEYALFRALRWVNTFTPLILPAWLAPAYFVFLLRQFMLTIPREMDDAARIDGCSSFRIYWQIMLPMARPALGVVAIYQALGAWNDFFRPLIYIHSKAQFTLALGLELFNNTGTGGAERAWNQMMAVSLVITLPVLVLFFALQRLFIQGIVVTGVKG